MEVTHIPFMQHVHVCTLPIPYFIPMNDFLSSDPGYLYSFKIIVELVIDIFFGKTAQIWENQSQKLSTESSKHSMKTAKLRIL